MDKKVYRILADLAKDSDKRNGESMLELADMLTTEGPNELKSLFNQWLIDNPDALDEYQESSEPVEETMLLGQHDAELLKKLRRG